LLSIAVLLLASRSFAQDCSITFALDDAVTAGALQFEVTYPHPNVSLNGSGAAVTCTDLTGSFPTFQDDDAGTLSTVLVSFAGIAGPRDVVTCNLTYQALPSIGDFVVTVTDASDPFTMGIVPLPSMSVSDLSCTGSTTTTTSTSLPGGGGGGSTSTSTSTTLSSQPVCVIDFELADAVTLGSLGYSVDYSDADGEFEGSGSAVTCLNLVTGAFATVNDDDGAREITTALIHLGGFSGPLPVSSCTFLPGAVDPVAGDFVVTVNDASDPSLSPVVPLPTVQVASIDCFDPSVTTTLPPTTTSTTTTTLPVCGDGLVQVGEECDDGVSNSDTEPDACRTDCTVAICGDAVVDSGEECDDGAANSNADPQTCRTDCTLEYVCGDADGSGKVNVVDAARILQVAVGLQSGCEPGRCDVNGDGRIRVSDGQMVLAAAVGLSVNLLCTRAVTVRVDDATMLGSISLEIDYSAAPSSFLGEGATVDCTSLLSGASASFDNDGAAAMLTIDVSSATGIAGPADVATCVLREHDTAPKLNNLQVTVTGANLPGGQPSAPLPSVSLAF